MFDLLLSTVASPDIIILSHCFFLREKKIYIYSLLCDVHVLELDLSCLMNCPTDLLTSSSFLSVLFRAECCGRTRLAAAAAAYDDVRLEKRQRKDVRKRPLTTGESQQSTLLIVECTAVSLLREKIFYFAFLATSYRGARLGNKKKVSCINLYITCIYIYTVYTRRVYV